MPMKIPATADDIRTHLRACATAAGSQRILAKRIGCSSALLSEVMRGTREPAGKVLAWLKLRREVRYVSK